MRRLNVQLYGHLYGPFKTLKILCCYGEFSRISACLTSYSLICCPLQGPLPELLWKSKVLLEISIKGNVASHSLVIPSFGLLRRRREQTHQNWGTFSFLRRFLSLICFHSNNLLFFPVGEVYIGLLKYWSNWNPETLKNLRRPWLVLLASAVLPFSPSSQL